MDYEQNAIEFCEKNNVVITKEFLKNDFHFADDKSKRDIYKITIATPYHKFSFDYGQSIINSQYLRDDRKPAQTYTLNGKARTGNIEIHNLQKYENCGNPLTLVNGKIPTDYDILASLTKYESETFEDFCYNYGYDNDSIKAKKIFKDVKKEYNNVFKAMFYCIEELREIN